jgi:hypothetical protein
MAFQMRTVATWRSWNFVTGLSFLAWLAFHRENGIFDLGFVSRFVGSRRHDRDAVVLRHLVIGSIEIGS